MNDLSEKYHERLLHWFWDTLQFDPRNLRTTSGKPLAILDKGELNSTDGPDFSNAHITADGLQWFGDVELHWSARDWKRHGHHRDPAFNKVILHVVYHQPGETEILREDGTTPFTLCLRSYLPDNIDRVISAFHQKEELPCAGQIRYISEEALQKQFDKAHREYFNRKTDYLLEFYDPDLPPGQAWEKILVLGLFDGLGIALNREPMVEVGQSLCRLLRNHKHSNLTKSDLEQQALKLAELDCGRNPDRWNYRGCRPANRPELRLRQGASMTWRISQIPFNEWYGQNPKSLWQKLLDSVQTTPGIGRERADIIYGIVFLPALWLLGNLFYIPDLKQTAFNCWMSHRAALPSSLLDLFERTDIPEEFYQQRLGAVYQLKHYCRPRRCSQCSVLKGLISS